jgi:hypothetical protein
LLVRRIEIKKVPITIGGCGVREGEVLKGWIAHEDVSKGRNYDAVSFRKED